MDVDDAAQDTVPPAGRRKEPGPGAGFGFAIAWLVTAVMLPWLWGRGVTLLAAVQSVPAQLEIAGLVSHGRPGGNCSITIFRLSDSTVARVQRLGLSSLADVTEGRASHGRRLPDWGTVHARYIDDDSAVNAIHCIGHGADLLRAVAPGIVHTGGFHAADVVHQLVLVPATGLLMVGQKID